MTEMAIKKLNDEKKAMKGGQKDKAIAGAVLNALCDFCRQNEEFARAVYRSDKSFGDCCAAIVRNCGNCLSDLDAYKRAVEFYFPGAVVTMSLSIYMSKYDVPKASEPAKAEAPAPAPEPVNAPASEPIVIDLMDLL